LAPIKGIKNDLLINVYEGWVFENTVSIAVEVSFLFKILLTKLFLIVWIS
jgi:hypothetical protein